MFETPKQKLVCQSLLYELNMRIQRVLGHTKRAMLACCERAVVAVAVVPVFPWRVTYTTQVDWCLLRALIG